MTRRISLITAVVGAALVLGVPAAWGDSWFNDQQANVRVSPDAIDRAVAAEQNRLSSMLDARERAFSAKQNRPVDFWNYNAQGERTSNSSPGLTPQGLSGLYGSVGNETASGPRPEGGPNNGDAINRMYGLGKYAQSTTRDPVVDDRFRIDHSNVPVPVSATSSGREIEWPQIGIGFGVGMILLLGLVLALKATHTRPFAH